MLVFSVAAVLDPVGRGGRCRDRRLRRPSGPRDRRNVRRAVPHVAGVLHRADGRPRHSDQVDRRRAGAAFAVLFVPQILGGMLPIVGELSPTSIGAWALAVAKGQPGLDPDPRRLARLDDGHRRRRQAGLRSPGGLGTELGPPGPGRSRASVRFLETPGPRETTSPRSPDDLWPCRAAAVLPAESVN